LIEINARFGGGFPLAWAAGARTTRWAIQFGAGLPPLPAALDWKSEVKMLRYDQSVFMDAS
jgi:carbamoyl-phosphate synthase large subunit